MKRAIIVVLPILFTAQACNVLFGDLNADKGTGPKGIFMSSDSGQTWEVRNQVGKERNLNNAQVLSIFIEGKNTRNLLAATFNSGVFASDNGGENWVQLLPNFGAYEVFINPRNDQEIFVAGNRNRFPAILKSSDRGGAWVETYSQPAAQGSVSAMTFDPRNPAVIFAGLTSGTVLKSLDGGQTWNALTDFKDRLVRLVISQDGNTLYAMLRTQGIKKSVDGGKNWNDVNLTEKATSYNDLIFDPRSSTTLYLASDKGLFRSENAGNAWTKLPLPATPEINIISAVGINPQNSNQLFVSVRSTVYRSDDRGQTWRTEGLPTNQIISDIAIDPREPNKIYVGLK